MQGCHVVQATLSVRRLAPYTCKFPYIQIRSDPIVTKTDLVPTNLTQIETLSRSTDELASRHAVVVEGPVLSADTIPFALFFKIRDSNVFPLGVKSGFEEIHFNDLMAISGEHRKDIKDTHSTVDIIADLSVSAQSIEETKATFRIQ